MHSEESTIPLLPHTSADTLIDGCPPSNLCPIVRIWTLDLFCYTNWEPIGQFLIRLSSLLPLEYQASAQWYHDIFFLYWCTRYPGHPVSVEPRAVVASCLKKNKLKKPGHVSELCNELHIYFPKIRLTPRPSIFVFPLEHLAVHTSPHTVGGEEVKPELYRKQTWV